jgi:Holliday junction resolvase RusA-like endonuclease
MKLILPVPPSVNELYSPNKGGGQRKSDKYKAWLDMAGRFYLVVKRTTEPVRGPYTVLMKVPANMRGDVDNRAKAALDFLKNMGLTDDDRHCVRATVERDEYLTAVAEIEVEAA